MAYKKELEQAFRLADTADEIAMKYYRSRDLVVETKPDDSPVTQGDKEVEKALNKIVVEEYGDGYIGEEGAETESSSRVWLVDPIDGTKNFLRGFPVWGSLISLKIDGEVVAACISAPALGRRWWASKGNGAFTQDVDGSKRQINVSKVNDLSDSFLLHGTFNSYGQVGLDARKVFDLIRSVWRHRSPGDFYGHMFVAEGVVDGFVEVPSALWDIEASKFIIEEAGGRVWISPDDIDTVKLQRLAISSNSLIESQIKNSLGLK